MKLRFAPSPTGYLHVGNTRTAIINYLFALKNNAEFILRIDDTDTKRSQKIYEDAIIEDLAWMDMSYSQMFHQSSQVDLYNQVKKGLIEAGLLYPCYETPEELDVKRKLQLKQGRPPVYDRSALTLSDAERKKLESEGRKPHWRFLLPDEEVSWVDLIHGVLKFHPNTMSDPVLVREDGSFLYTLPSVIDDVNCGITHVVRGEDHVSNTAVQIPVYRAVSKVLSKSIDVAFAHTTLLANFDGSALSKRIGSLGIRDFRAQGIEPDTIRSYLAFLGTKHAIDIAFGWNDLLKTFDIKDYGGATPKFNPDDIALLNGKYYQNVDFKAINTSLHEGEWRLVKYNINKKDDIAFWEQVFSENFRAEQDFEQKHIAAQLLPHEPWDDDTWHTWANALKDKTGLKGKELFAPLRLSLTGCSKGPEMKDLIQVLGRSRVLTRLSAGRN